MAAHQDPRPIKIDICKGVEGAGFLYAEIEMDAAPAKFGVRSSRVGAVQHQPAGHREFLIGNCIAEPAGEGDGVIAERRRTAMGENWHEDMIRTPAAVRLLS